MRDKIRKSWTNRALLTIKTLFLPLLSFVFGCDTSCDGAGCSNESHNCSDDILSKIKTDLPVWPGVISICHEFLVSTNIQCACRNENFARKFIRLKIKLLFLTHISFFVYFAASVVYD
ncbi:hypothetical protein BpHYR1_031977 [Brachionus plicatilis]|uniref:Uncharacterized protein n=1 Tax=Brachionus plicatilis TaxID=10195 RepID=A0A3M7PGP4_BRAPC|nr:hypothetical protein BpHYR1_031977 [Brachionus plicatilis]